MVAPQVSPQHGPLAILVIAASITMLAGTGHGAFCQPNSGTCWPDRAALSTWISRLSGATNVYQWDRTPDKFLSAAATANALKTNFPGIIVAPVSENDLSSSLQFAYNYKIRVVTRCSGQDYNGRSNGRGVMMIRMEKFNYVEYNPDDETVTFGAGATQEMVYAVVADVNRVFVGGLSTSICPAGCLAGGCYGPLSRLRGLGIDNILQIRFMLYNGTILTLSRTRYADLFHAYLGAGQNSFGVAISFTARTFPAPRQILQLEVQLDLINPALGGATYPNLFSDYIFNVRWFNSLPNELSGTILVSGNSVHIRFFYAGEDYVGAFNSLQPMLNSPYRTSVTPITNYSSILEMVRETQPASAEIWSRTFIANTFVAPRQDILNNASRIIGESQPSMWLWFMFGGAVQASSTGSVPAGMRGAMYEVLFADKWFDPAEDEPRMDYINSAYLPTLYAFGSSSYNNEYTTWGNRFNTLNDWKSRFFNDYNRLVGVKSKYDPCNLFTVRFGVASDLPTATC